MAPPVSCAICNRTAVHHHYGVVSCKGCKTFFRRMIVSKLKVKCELDSDCFDLSEKHKPHLRCRACRYQKCVAVGMNPDAIEGSKHRSNSRIGPQQLLMGTLNNVDLENQKYINVLSRLEWKLEEFRKSTYLPQWTDFSGLESIIQSTSKLSLADKYAKIPDWSYKKRGLRSTSDKENFTAPKIWSLCNFLTITEYIKTFEFFHKLNARDQYLLSRYAALPCYNLHTSYFAVSNKNSSCLQPDGAIEPQEDQSNYQSAVLVIGPLIRSQIQPIEYYLLKAICACNPAVPDLSQCAQSILTDERRRMGNILFDHCLRNGSHGPSRMAELLGIFYVLESQQKIQRDMYASFVSPKLSNQFKKKLGFLHEIMSFETIF